jgi:alkylated DNA repair dioxygenase AlkB
MEIQTTKSALNTYLFKDLDLLNKCVDEIKDKLITRPEIVVYGKTLNQNRNVGFFSNESIGYNYSKKLMKSQALTSSLIKLLKLINNKFNSDFNGILVNEYTTGTDYIGAHSDDEKGLSNSGVVAISFGSTRKFRIRNKKTKKIEKDILLNHGQIIQMSGDFQKEFTHEIPIERKITDSRFSFTFRTHK